jgi:hypothetical protein
MKHVNYLSYLNLQDASPKAHEIIEQNYSNISTNVYKDIELALSYLTVKNSIKKEMLSFYEKHKSNLDLIRAAVVIRMLTVEYAHPSEWLVTRAPKIIALEEQVAFHVLTLLLIAGYQIQYMQSRGFDDTHIQFNMGHLSNYIQDYYNKYHKLGTELYTWCLYLASIGLIHLHTLHFMHHIYTDQNMVFQHHRTGEKIMLALSDIDVRKDGQFNRVNGIDNYAFTTTFEEDEESYTGYYVNPYGAITNNLLTLSKHEYRILLQPGDATIDYHIPTGPGYNIVDVKQSFEEAMTFFSTMYPEEKYKAFWCVSWLSSPQIPLFLCNQEGNIYNINQQSYSFPATNDQSSILEFVFHDGDIDLKAITPQTSLERDIIHYNAKGFKINCGIFLYFLEDLHRFGDSPYRQDHHCKQFLQMNS